MGAYYPTVLHENENIYFTLKCRKFIEMIRRVAELADGTSPNLPPSKSNDDHNGVFDHQMELDDQFSAIHNGTHNKWDDGTMDTSDDTGGTALHNHVDHNEMMNRTLAYGAELREEFDQDPRREVKKTLQETLALIAYPDPSDSPLSHLLEEKERIPVAEELNGAILGSFGQQLQSGAMLTVCSEPWKILIVSPGATVCPNRRSAHRVGRRRWCGSLNQSSK